MAEYVNNHIHTTYSFSPYTPAQAVKKAKESGLMTAGIMDHDSVGGAKQFIAAGKKEGIATTTGFECRVRMDGTPFYGRRLNNPDQISNAYVACHGIPHQHIDTAQAWLAPYRKRRNVRNRRMVETMNKRLLTDTDMRIDFDRDVAGVSMCADGGSVTERHILYALVEQLLSHAGGGAALVRLLENKMGMALGEKQRAALLNTDGQYYEYTLLGILKSSLIGSFYIGATDECPMVQEFLSFVRSIGAIPAYAYLGDVGDSVTGDKKARRFEDGYLDDLFPWLKETGFLAVTYMPTRNTARQLLRVMKLCDDYALFQISGEDINSPAQGFRCAALELPEYKRLITSAWALIGHENAASEDVENGIFSCRSKRKMPSLQDRIRHFAARGRCGS
jgi:hypothetical protein